MKPWEVLATLLETGAIRAGYFDLDGVVHFHKPTEALAFIVDLRTMTPITLDNVRRIQVEHWPISHRHGGPVSPDNALISLSESHMEHTARETQGRGKERRLRIARLAKTNTEKPIGKPKKWRFKKKIGSNEVVKVRTR